MTWKALDHPKVLSLLGVIMTGTQFAMVSKWMTNGNIKEFVKTRRDANRFELVRLRSGFRDPRSPLTIMTSVVRRRHKGLDISARPGDSARGSQRGRSFGFRATPHI